MPSFFNSFLQKQWVYASFLYMLEDNGIILITKSYLIFSHVLVPLHGFRIIAIVEMFAVLPFVSYNKTNQTLVSS